MNREYSQMNDNHTRTGRLVHYSVGSLVHACMYRSHSHGTNYEKHAIRNLHERHGTMFSMPVVLLQTVVTVFIIAKS